MSKRTTLATIFAASLCFAGAMGCASTPAPEDQELAEQTAETEEARNPHHPARPFVDSDEIPLGDSHTFGDPNAPIVVVEFMSLQCQFCARGADTVKDLQEIYPGEVQVVFKHFPLEFQSQSYQASRYVEAAGRQGMFWEMRDGILERIPELANRGADAVAEEVARELGLDLDQLGADLDDPAIDARIDADLELGRSLGVRGTPAFFVNGIRVVGAQSLETFQQVTAAARALNEELAERGVETDHLYRNSVAAALAHEETAEPTPPEPTGLQPGLAVEYPIEDSDLAYGETEDFLVTIVEFSSMQCPHCARSAGTIQELAKEYDDLRIVFQHHPLEFQRHARPASKSIVAAENQGSGAAMIHLIFSEQNRLEEHGIFDEWAGRLDLDLERFQEDMRSDETEALIEDNLARAGEIGVRGTPTFLVNGVVVLGAQPYQHFMEIIEAERSRAQEVRDETGLGGEELYRELLGQASE